MGRVYGTGMKRWQKVLLSIVLVIAVPIVGLVVTRAINQQRYFNHTDQEAFGGPSFDLRDAKAYPLDVLDGVTITPVTGEHMAGFHMKPTKRTRPGVTVSYGGSEGGAGWFVALGAAAQGQEALALFFWGQPNQTPFLDEVPLDHFQEVIDWIDAHAESPKPLIVAGGSKGAEYTANLLPRYDRIDHAILIAPGSYSFPALSNDYEHSSWTYKGEPVPFVSWAQGGQAARQAFMGEVWKWWVNLPVTYGPAYDLLVDHASEEARIRIEDSRATMRVFAGEDDALWPSARMAAQLKDAAPSQVDVTTYPGVGHMPGLPRYLGGLNMGGSDEANKAAAQPFRDAIRDQIAEWAPEE